MNKLNKAPGFVLLAVVGSLLTVNSAKAQSSSKGYGTNLSKQYSYQNSASQYSSDNIRQRLLNNSVTSDSRLARPNLGSYSPPASGLSSKPFSTISRAPTVSPYLALNNSFNQVSDYYNIVRPLQEQQRVNQQLQRQTAANQHRLNRLAARGPYNPRGDENSVPTGHAAVFQSLGTYLNTGGYFSGPPR